MSMKKAIDQTLRDIKRGVNKKVLKVPSIEQKVLDATSNEPWGPHGSLLADIAYATRNYHEYQMIMVILWKRLNDIGKNWRHVYKALTVLEYLVAHGAERVIVDIKEHAYQISTLSDFQYIDSSGKDQGNNVRRKSQSLVALVNHKERIQEVREKAAINREKFRSSSAAGGMYRPGSGGYGDDRYEGRYGGRDDDRNGYGRERDGGFRDDERYGRYGDSYNQNGDHYGRDSEDQYNRDGYRDDESRGRSRSEDDYQYGSKSRSSDGVGNRGFDEDDRPPSRRFERKFSEQNLGAPPNYEEAVGSSRSPTFSERDGETPPARAAQLSPPTVPANAAQSSSPVVGATQSSSPVVGATQSSSPVVGATQSSPIADAVPQPSPAPNNVSPSQATVEDGVSSHAIVPADSFDEFDPRGSVTAAQSTPPNAEMDLLGSLSDAFSPGPLAIMPASFEASDLPTSNPTSTPATSQNTNLNQTFEDPFGDSPFRAIPSNEPAQPHNFTSSTSFLPYTASDVQNSPNQLNASREQPLQHTNAPSGTLPPSAPFATSASQTSFPAPTNQAPFATPVSQTAFDPYASQTAFYGQPGQAPFPHMAYQNSGVQPGQLTRHQSLPDSTPYMSSSTNIGMQGPTRMSSLPNDDLLGGFLQQSPPSSSENSLALVPVENKFETKSTVWADTLNRGLVNLNISGSKTNPLSNIGVDFESLNRKEKRMEKPSTAIPTSSASMGKAMGSGSGIGRAGMMGPGMGMGMGMARAPGVGMGMGNYGPVNMNQQPMGMGMGGMGVNMGMGRPPMGQGMPMQPSYGSAPNLNNYQMTGRGGYPPQQTYQYPGGYR